MKLDAEFPRFTQALLETVFPHYLAPKPSMAVAQFQPDFRQDSLNDGFLMPRGTVLRSIPGKGDRTPCKYVTAHDVRLFPLHIADAAYHTRDLASLDIPPRIDARAAIRLRFEAKGGRSIADLKLDSLALYLKGAGEMSMRIYEQALSRCTGIAVRPVNGGRPGRAEVLPPDSLKRVGFRPEEAMLPFGARSFQGYRLVEEYFCFPERFMFLEITGLSATARRCASDSIEILLFLNAADLSLEGKIGPQSFELNCTPAVNLFHHRTDRIHVTEGQSEFHVVPDRTRPLDYEVYSVRSVTGFGPGQEPERSFMPFYAAKDADAIRGSAFFTSKRIPRAISESHFAKGNRLTYTGSEVYLSLVDSEASPWSQNLQQLGVDALCTNRDLPLRMPLGTGRTDFTLDSPAPVQAVRCVGGPTEPRPSLAHGPTAWRLISHLSLNYLSLTDAGDGSKSAAALREMLRLYIDPSSPGMRKQVDGLAGVSAKPIVRRVLGGGAIAFARGLEVVLKLDESGFEGTGAFLFGAVLEQFFSRYVSVNSFTETVVETQNRGQIMRWTPRIGQRETL